MLEYTRMSLGGGLEAIVTPVPESVPVTLSLWIRAGSDHEGEGEAGASHLARHALLGSARRSQAWESLVASGGEVEAWTSRRSTAVTVHAPPGGLDQALELLAPFIRPQVPGEEALARARKAVELEADGWWADPRARARDALHSLALGPERTSSLYPDLATLGHTDPGAVSGFLERTYTSGRMVLAASLSATSARSLSLPVVPRKGGREEPASSGARDPFSRVLAAPGPMPEGASLVLAGTLLPAPGSQEGAGAHLLAGWLGGQGPGSIDEHLTELTGAFGSTQIALDATRDGNLVSIAATAAPGTEVAAVRAMASALALTTVLGPQGPSLEREALGTAATWMVHLGDPVLAPILLARHEHLCLGVEPEDHLSSLFDVGPAEVASLARGFEEPGGIRFVISQSPHDGHDPVEPLDPSAIDEASSAAVKQTLDLVESARKRCGHEGQARAQSSTQGLSIVTLRTPGPATVAVTGLIGAGSLNEAPGHEGTAKLLSLLMTKKLESAVHLSAGLDPDYVVSSGVYHPDRVGVHLVVPRDRWLEGVLAVRSAILAPRITSPLFEAMRQKCIAASGAPVDPRARGTRAVLGALVGLEEGYDPDGTVASLGTLTPEEVRSFHRAGLARSASIGIAGEMDASGPCAAATVAFHARSARTDEEAITLVSPAPGAQPAGGQPAVVEGAGSMAWITAAWAVPGLAGKHLPVQLIARLLDGPDGLLARTIVDAKGLATAIEVETWATSGWGMLVVHAHAPAINVEAVIAALRASLENMALHPPSHDEIEEAREAILARRAHDLALPATAGRLVALEALLVGAGSAGAPIDKALGAIGRNAIAETLASYVTGSEPAIAVYAP
jgi:predicted Zn-dependent peptidase